jgi:hypothetical protein
MAEPQLFLASLVCMYLVLRVQGFFIRPSSPPSFPTTIFSRSFSRNLSLYANSEKINGEDPKSRGDCKKKTSKEPKTGWTHSTPDPTSDFWEPGPERPKPNEEPKKLRTGWLHNAESKEKKSLSVTDASGLPNSGKTGGFSEAQRRLQLAMRQQERNHRIIAPPTLHACGTDFPIVITEHKISLPLSRVEPPSRLDVYFTIVEKVRSEKDRKWFAGLASRSPQQRAGDYVAFANMETATDMILYLQGGPGFGAPVPVASLGLEKDSSWAAKALEMYTRVVLMDQRGTGQSTPITKQTLEIKFPNLFLLDSKETVNLTLNELEGEDAALVKQAVLEAFLVNKRHRPRNRIARRWGWRLGKGGRFFAASVRPRRSLKTWHPFQEPDAKLKTGALMGFLILGLVLFCVPVYALYRYRLGQQERRIKDHFIRGIARNISITPSAGALSHENLLEEFQRIDKDKGGTIEKEGTSHAQVTPWLDCAAIVGTRLTLSRVFRT